MAFLPKFNDPSYQNANVNRFDVRQPEPQSGAIYSIRPNPAVEAVWGGGRGIGSQGMMDQVARGGGGRSSGGGGGNADGSPNVVYDQQPEQFARQMKLREKEVEAEGSRRASELENDKMRAQAAMIQADAMANYRQTQGALGAEKNDIERFKAQNPNMRVVATKGGTWAAIDPRTGQAVDTGISTGTMTESDALAGKNQGAMDLQGLRNTGAKEVQGLRNTGNMDVANANNLTDIEVANLNNLSREQIAQLVAANKLDVTHLGNTGAQALEQLRQQGRLGLQNNAQNFQRNSQIYKTGENLYSNVIKEGLDPKAMGIDRPNFPQPLVFGNMPNVSSPINSLGTATPTLGNPMQFGPSKNDGFTAKPGQFTAAQGQFEAGSPAGQIAAEGGNPAELEADAKDYLTRVGKAHTPENLAKVMKALQDAKKSGNIHTGNANIPGAGVVNGTPAGQTTGLPAGTIPSR